MMFIAMNRFRVKGAALRQRPDQDDAANQTISGLDSNSYQGTANVPTGGNVKGGSGPAG
jgi:hypothetical protein